MASVRSRDNISTERALSRMMWAAGIRGYRKHWRILGKPDFAWPGRKIAIFVDGCFWHGCACKRLPATNKSFWRSKIETNKARDKRIARTLRASGWKVLRIKECVVKKPATLARIQRLMESTK